MRLLYAVDPMDFEGGPPASNPALPAGEGVPPKLPDIPITDAADEFAGDGDDGSMALAPNEEFPDQTPAGEPPATLQTPPADSASSPPAPTGEVSAPDAMPGEAEFDAWAKANPEGAQRYLDAQEASLAASQADTDPDYTSPFSDPAEQALNIDVHLQRQNDEYSAAFQKFTADKKTVEQDEKKLEDAIAARRELNLPTDDPIIETTQRMLAQRKAELNTKANELTSWNNVLDRVEAANKMVDKLPAVLGAYRELYVELASQGRFNRCNNFEQQKSVLNTELVARGMPRMGEKPAARRIAEPSAAVKRYRALRSGTAPQLQPGKDRTPPARAARPAPGSDGLSQLAPSFRAAVEKIAKK